MKEGIHPIGGLEKLNDFFKPKPSGVSDFDTEESKERYKNETKLDPDKANKELGIGTVTVSAHFLEWLSADANEASRLRSIIEDLKYEMGTATIHYGR